MKHKSVVLESVCKCYPREHAW